MWKWRFCYIIVPSENNKILEFNQHQKSDETPFMIYADLEFIIEKTDACKNNPERSQHIPSAFSMFKLSRFRSIENKHDVKIVWKSFVNS